VRLLIVQPPAIADIDSILSVSRRQFGDVARERYSALIGQALADVRDDPLRIGVTTLPDLPSDLRLYHLRYARARIAKAIRTARPRHLMVFTFDAETVRILRVLHDAMDLPRHLGEAEE
jgi:toxin ParE1/3/4